MTGGSVTIRICALSFSFLLMQAKCISLMNSWELSIAQAALKCGCSFFQRLSPFLLKSTQLSYIECK